MKRLMLLTAVLLPWATIASAVTVDGTVDAEYGTALAVQDTPTGFGSNTSPTNPSNGNELNAAYGFLDGNRDLALMLTGNLQPGGNGLVIFVDSRAGGAIAGTVGADFGVMGSVGGARTDDWGTDTDGGPGVTTPTGGPSILDPGFNPDVSIEINAADGGNPTSYYTNIIDLTTPNEPDPERDIYLGVNTFGAPSSVQTYTRTDTDTSKGHNGTIEHAFVNTNTAGVNGFDFGSPPGPLGDPLSATTGYEALISSAFLANDGQPIRIMAFITNGDGGFLANQFLGENGVDGMINLGGPGFEGGTPLFDAQVLPGNQFFTVPEPDEDDGDHNGDGVVDAADHVAWKKMDGGNQDGYDAFFENFGEAPGGGSGGVPEPSSLLLMVVGGLFAFGFQRRK